MTNARKSREKHRMEREQELIKEAEQSSRQFMTEHNQVWKCSGTLEHMPNCGGDCGVVELTELEIALNEERQRWADIGMAPVGTTVGSPIPGIPVEIHHLEVSLAALIDYLEMIGGIPNRKALNEVFQKMMLERLTAIREANQDAVIAARRRQSIAPIPSPQIEIPDHIRRRMQ